MHSRREKEKKRWLEREDMEINLSRSFKEMEVGTLS